MLSKLFFSFPVSAMSSPSIGISFVASLKVVGTLFRYMFARHICGYIFHSAYDVNEPSENNYVCSSKY